MKIEPKDRMKGCIHKCGNGNKCYEIVRDKDETFEKLKKECDRFHKGVRG